MSVEKTFGITMTSKNMNAEQRECFLLGAEAILNAIIRERGFTDSTVVSARDMVVATLSEMKDGLREDFKSKAVVLGIPAEWYGKIFKHKRTWLKVIGIDRCHALPIRLTWLV